MFWLASRRETLSGARLLSRLTACVPPRCGTDHATRSGSTAAFFTWATTAEGPVLAFPTTSPFSLARTNLAPLLLPLPSLRPTDRPMLRSSRLSAAAAARAGSTSGSSSSLRLAAGKSAAAAAPARQTASPAAFASLARAYATKTGHSFIMPTDSYVPPFTLRRRRLRPPPSKELTLLRSLAPRSIQRLRPARHAPSPAHRARRRRGLQDALCPRL